MLVTRQPLVLEDVGGDPRFARDAAESTGYVPRGLMAVPLLHGERALGVLQVLDRESERFSLAEIDLLGLFANQAAIALDLLARARRARALLEGDGEAAVVARLAALVDARAQERRRDRRVRFLEALEALLRDAPGLAAAPRGDPGLVGSRHARQRRSPSTGVLELVGRRASTSACPTTASAQRLGVGLDASPAPRPPLAPSLGDPGRDRAQDVTPADLPCFRPTARNRRIACSRAA